MQTTNDKKRVEFTKYLEQKYQRKLTIQEKFIIAEAWRGGYRHGISATVETIKGA